MPITYYPLCFILSICAPFTISSACWHHHHQCKRDKFTGASSQLPLAFWGELSRSLGFCECSGRMKQVYAHRSWSIHVLFIIGGARCHRRHLQQRTFFWFGSEIHASAMLSNTSSDIPRGVGVRNTLCYRGKPRNYQGLLREFKPTKELFLDK